MSRPKHYFLRIFNIHWPISSLFYGVWWKTQCGIICQWLLFSTLSRLKQVHCFRNASFIATWKHLASEAVLSTQPSLKWSLIKSNRSSCKGSISWFFCTHDYFLCYHPMVGCLRSSMNIAFFLCMHIIFWRLFSFQVYGLFNYQRQK